MGAGGGNPRVKGLGHLHHVAVAELEAETLVAHDPFRVHLARLCRIVLAPAVPSRAEAWHVRVRVGVGVRVGVRVRVRVSGSVGLAPHFRMREELPCLVQRYGRGVIRHLVRPWLGLKMGSGFELG